MRKGIRYFGMQIYIDGKFYPKEEAKVSVFDHGFLYGDGVFEGIRAYSGKYSGFMITLTDFMILQKP